jgi:ubiquinone biosynthesis UbiH/UbiF/VisC/COQ6 family hydroxylase
MSADIAVVGAGLVGASFAAALAGTPLEIVVLERERPRDDAHAWDQRVYAVGPASVRFLASLGAWDAVDRTRRQPVLAMEVFGDAGSRLRFSAYEAGVPELATIVESRALQRALWDVLEMQPNVRLRCPARPAALAAIGLGWQLTLDDGDTFAPRLLVGADGTRSWVREAAGISVRSTAYAQRGVVANFACERDHEGVAFQWFRGADGVLAWLPLPGRRMSMVWSTPDEHAEELLALGTAALAERVAAAGSNRLGRLELLTPAAAFPLAAMAARRIAMPGLALLGDAAHAVHPLAGQGVNLGFADARVLASLVRGREVFREPGDAALMRRYERARSEDILAMRSVTHGLQRLFSLRGQLPAAVRNLGLNLTDDLAVVKNLLVRQALG